MTSVRTLSPTMASRPLPVKLLTLACLIMTLAATFVPTGARGQTTLITQEDAARAGLERAWFANVPVDPSRSRVTSWYLYKDRLYAVTNSGVVSAMNAETGEHLWSKQVGKPGYPAFGPSANADYLGIVSGSKLYVLNRHNGRAEWVRPLGSAPSSGPALSDSYAYVALMTGRIEAYKLDEPDSQPWYYQSRGRTYLRPTVTGRVVSWPTTEGFVYIGMAEDPGVVFRLETSGDIVTSPAHQEPYLYLASLDGYLYCINEVSGREMWRYSTGYAITSSPAIVGQQAYVASSEPSIHAINSETGEHQWHALGVAHFAAQGTKNVYGADVFGNLVVLDPNSGAVLHRLGTPDESETLVNDQSDRVFLVNDRGLVQCLREIGAVEPTLYQRPAPPAAEGDAPAATPPAPGGTPAADEGSPFEEEAPADAGSPFGEEAPTEEDAMEMEEPVEEPAASDNPFDF